MLRVYGEVGFEIPDALEKNITSPRTVQLLTDALKNAQAPTQAPRRAQLVTDLGRTHLPAAAGAVVLAMEDASPIVRAQAIAAAAILKAPNAGDKLQKLIEDPEPVVRRQGVLAANTLLEPAPAQALIVKALSDPSPLVQTAAIAESRGPESAAALAQALPKLPAAIAPLALDALGQLGYQQNIDVIAAAASTSIPHRIAAIKALGRLNAKGQIELIRGALTDENPSVRRAALEAFSIVADPASAQQTAWSMLTDTDVDVQATAVRLMGPVDTEAKQSALIAALPSSHKPLHDAALEALGRGTPEITPKIIQSAVTLVNSKDENRITDGAWLLGHYKSDVAVDRLIALLSSGSDNSEMVSQVMLSLGQIGDKRAAEPLARQINATLTAFADKTAGGTSSRTLGSAYRALGQLKDPQVLVLAKNLLALKAADTPSEPRAAAIYATGLAGQASNQELVGQLQSILRGQGESPEARFEAAKALANIGANESADFLKDAAGSLENPKVRYGAYLAYRALTGLDLPYTPPTADYSADTSLIAN